MKKGKLFWEIFNLIMRYRYIFLLLIFGLVPYVYYTSLNTPYTAIEFYSNKNYFTTWSNLFFGNFVFFLLPVDYFIYIMSHLFSSGIVTNLVYGILLSIGGIGTYFVSKKLVKHDFISFIVALFYMYGIYGQFASFWDGINILVAVLPLITLHILTISPKTHLLKTAIILALLLFLLTGVNLTFLAYLIIWIGVLSIYKVLEVGWRKTYLILLIVALGGIFSLLLSSYFYLAIFSQFHYQSSIINTSLALESPVWKSSASWLQELIREMGAVSYYYYFKGYSYPNAQIFINNPLFIFVSFVFPFLAFSSSVLYRKLYKENKILLHFFILFIILFFMTMGLFYLSPTKHLYKWFYDHIPYFSVFRDAYKPMFLIHFMYAILIGYTLKYFLIYRQKLFPWLATLTIICIAIISFQFWSGTFLRQEIIQIPRYWNNFARYMADKRQKITLTLPNMNFTGYEFTTIKGKNTVFFRSIFDNNVIYEQGGTVYDDQLIKTLYASVLSEPQCFTKLSGLLGVSYILNQYDLYVQLYDNSTTAVTEDKALSKMLDVKFEKQFGKLKFYSLSPRLVYDPIFIPEKIVAENTQDYCHMAHESSGKNSIAFVNTSEGIQNSSSHATVAFHNYNDSMYSVQINNMKHDELLVLNKRYDGGWMIFELSQKQGITPKVVLSLLFQHPLQAKHIGVNSFVNGWYIQKTSPSRNLILIYMPQLYFYWGLIISGSTLIILLLLLLIFYVKKK